MSSPLPVCPPLFELCMGYLYNLINIGNKIN
jgi:hypothetical protein